MAQHTISLYIVHRPPHGWLAIAATYPPESDKPEGNEDAPYYAYAFHSKDAIVKLAVAMQDGPESVMEAIGDGEIFRNDTSRTRIYENLFQHSKALWYQDVHLIDTEGDETLESIIKTLGIILEDTLSAPRS